MVLCTWLDASYRCIANVLNFYEDVYGNIINGQLVTSNVLYNKTKHCKKRHKPVQFNMFIIFSIHGGNGASFVCSRRATRLVIICLIFHFFRNMTRFSELELMEGHGGLWQGGVGANSCPAIQYDSNGLLTLLLSDRSSFNLFAFKCHFLYQAVWNPDVVKAQGMKRHKICPHCFAQAGPEEGIPKKKCRVTQHCPEHEGHKAQIYQGSVRNIFEQMHLCRKT